MTNKFHFIWNNLACKSLIHALQLLTLVQVWLRPRAVGAKFCKLEHIYRFNQRLDGRSV